MLTRVDADKSALAAPTAVSDEPHKKKHDAETAE
jgi:hypothetical protein